MFDKFQQWLRVKTEADQHLSNSDAAGAARAHHIHDRVNGVERVVDRHLARIEQREINLYDLCRFIAESPALNDQEDE